MNGYKFLCKLIDIWFLNLGHEYLMKEYGKLFFIKPDHKQPQILYQLKRVSPSNKLYKVQFWPQTFSFEQECNENVDDALKEEIDFIENCQYRFWESKAEVRSFLGT